MNPKPYLQKMQKKHMKPQTLHLELKRRRRRKKKQQERGRKRRRLSFGRRVSGKRVGMRCRVSVRVKGLLCGAGFRVTEHPIEADVGKVAVDP